MFDEIFKSKIFIFLKNTKELIVLVIFYLSFVSSPVFEDQLLVEYELSEFTPPFHLQECYKSKKCMSIEAENEKQFFRFFNSKKMLEIKLQNNTNKKIEDLDLKVFGVLEVADVGLRTRSSDILENKEKILTYKYHDEGALYFSDFKVLPPGSTVTIFIWGHIASKSFGNQIEVVSSADSFRIAKFGRTSAVRLFIANNINTILFLVAGYLLLVALRRMKKQKNA